MRSITIDNTGSGFAPAAIGKEARRLAPELARLKAAAQKRYATDYASINLPEDRKQLEQARSLARQYADADLLVVVGIGGSNLGALAVQEALLGRLHNLAGRPRILWADTVDAGAMKTIAETVERTLSEGKRVLINAVSKSGSTTETIANFAILAEILKRHEKGYARSVVVTTDEGSKFWEYAGREGFARLAIPEQVGGRYSVFSAVGLFPLAVLGVDIDGLVAGAAAMRTRCLAADVAKNPAALGAAAQYLHLRKGRNISDLFLFSPDLEAVGKWNRQLVAESVGKEFDKSGKKRVFAGVTPTVSIGSTDLHSMGQLYLGGPFDKFTTFVTIDADSELVVPDGYDALVSRIGGRGLGELMDAIAHGTMAAFRKTKRPFRHVALPDRTAASIGQFLQERMMETILLAALMDVNPFDQPNVELYKTEMRAILKKK